LLKFTSKPSKAFVNSEITVKMAVQLQAKKLAADCNIDWGDGKKDAADSASPFKHTYLQSGKFTITASASIKESGTYPPPSSVTAEITVTIDPPDIQLTKSTPPAGTGGYNFTIKANPGSYPLGNWTLTLGDGKSETGQGKVSKTVNHVYSKDGTYKIELSVTDSTGAVTKKSLNLTIAPKKSSP
jgi:PKD repeat protein